MQVSSLNKAQIIGRLGADPESKFGKSGNAVTKFNVATSERWKDGSEQDQERTEWHRVVMFGKMAEVAGEYLKKGQLVYVEGRIKTDSWEDDQGIKRYSTSINADTFTMLGKKDSGTLVLAEKEGDEKVDDSGDDLPF